MIVGLDGIRKAYRTGQSKFLTRATARIENVTPRKKGIVVTELPHLVGPEKVIARIKETVASKKLQGITDVADLTDCKNGTRLVITVKNGFSPSRRKVAVMRTVSSPRSTWGQVQWWRPEDQWNRKQRHYPYCQGYYEIGRASCRERV